MEYCKEILRAGGAMRPIECERSISVWDGGEGTSSVGPGQICDRVILIFSTLTPFGVANRHNIIMIYFGLVWHLMVLG